MRSIEGSLTACVLACAVAVTGCSKDSESPGSGERSGSASQAKRKGDHKDSGSASMKMDEVTWQADSARPRLVDGKLAISASRTKMSDEKLMRQELKLTIKDFKGPGTYTLQMTDAMYIGVGMDVDKAKAAAEDEEATRKAAADVLAGSDMMMMPGAVVTIETANDKEVTGTFSWTPPPHDKGKPAITDGTFRAVYRD